MQQPHRTRQQASRLACAAFSTVVALAACADPAPPAALQALGPTDDGLAGYVFNCFHTRTGAAELRVLDRADVERHRPGRVIARSRSRRMEQERLTRFDLALREDARRTIDRADVVAFEVEGIGALFLDMPRFAKRTVLTEHDRVTLDEFAEDAARYCDSTYDD